MNGVAPAITELPESEGVPLYVRLAASLRTGILQGEWPVGARLPTFEALAARYGVAMNTVRKAVALLASQQLVVSGRGSGTVVAARSSVLSRRDLRLAISDPLTLADGHRIDVISSRRVPTLPEELRGEARLAPSYQRVFKTQRIGETPYAVLDIYVASAFFARFARGAERRSKMSQLLRADPDARIVRSRQELTVTHSDQSSAALLRYPVAAPLVRVRRWRQTADEVVVYACTVLYRSDLFVWDVTRSEPDVDHFATHLIPEVRPVD